MPRGDGTGPMGGGSATGRGFGGCGEEPAQRPWRVFERGFWREGLGFGRGRRSGHRNWFNATGLTGWQRALEDQTVQGGWRGRAIRREDETEALRRRAEYHQSALAEIRQRLDATKKKLDKTD